MVASDRRADCGKTPGVARQRSRSKPAPRPGLRVRRVQGPLRRVRIPAGAGDPRQDALRGHLLFRHADQGCRHGQLPPRRRPVARRLAVDRLKNIGNVTLTNIQVVDTLKKSLSPLSVTSNASLNGQVVSYHKDSLIVGQSDSILVKVHVPINLSNKDTIVNHVIGKSDLTPPQDTTAQIITRVIVSNKSCRIQLTANPSLLLGDGLHYSRIDAFASDTNNLPKPDGTPILFTTPLGKFSNGLDSIIVPTVNGHAIDSLSANVIGIGIVENYAKVSVNDADVCSAVDSIKVVFFPGAITGIVIDQNNNNEPIPNVPIDVIGPESRRYIS